MATSLYVAFDVYPRPKGSSSHIRSMVSALAAHTGRVRVLCLGADDLPLHEDDGRIEIRRLHLPGSDLLRRATAFAQFVIANTPDAAKIAIFRDPWGGVPLLRNHPHIPAIFECNALPSWELAYSRPGVVQSPTLLAKIGDMERFSLRRAAHVLCVSAVTRNTLVAESLVDPARCVVHPNAAASHFFEQPAAANPIEALNTGHWFGYIGALQPWQGLPALLDAWALAAPDLPAHRLLILHSGNRDLRDIQRRIAKHNLRDRILLHEPIAPEPLAAVFRHLRFTVAPLTDTERNTRQGCCPIKIVESMAAGTPVLASDLAVTRELITHDVDGLLTPPGDARSLAQAILAMDRHRDRLAPAAQATAAARFHQASAHAKLAELLQNMA